MHSWFRKDGKTDELRYTFELNVCVLS